MVEIQGPYEGLVKRFWETLERLGIGVLRPRQIRRVGGAEINIERRRRLVEAQTQFDVGTILSGQKLLAEDGSTLLETAPPARLNDAAVLMAQRIIVGDHLRSQANVAKALLVAESELQSNPQEPPEEEVDDDWFFRWRKLAGEVSTEKLQGLWGRVLAGEIKSPGDFSLRTLEFLSTLSQDDARLLESIGPFVLRGELLATVEFDGTSILECEGITLFVRMQLEELGILSTRDRLTYRMESHPAALAEGRFEQGLESHGRILLLRHENPRQELKLPAHRLTSLGEQVLKIGVFDPHEEYLRQIGSHIKEKGFEVAIADVKGRSKSYVSYENAVEL